MAYNPDSLVRFCLGGQIRVTAKDPAPHIFI